MAPRLPRMTKARWGRLSESALRILVRAGVAFTDGKQVKHQDQEHTEMAIARSSHPTILYNIFAVSQ